ncbi:DUF418 domain-containing protein [Streptomyces europaeiscabiei]|uniref:DUF418 domain-containing protein n=1 Tax=Streptomyces europaeiscabiei TaxID=146819 RepID=UPI00099EB882|nr:DUF418 domain-containing protein [Streptomyces europaeiscabiei]MDX2766707.1 DUF418 domain-containing protein [Streptomyces europaeiscabiei]MDX3665567.1 DUF418 domain-containing protein [Streptomyces europaeiscabiei]
MNLTTPALGDTAPTPVPRRETARRITALDALRGFALCGILLVNVNQITPMNQVDSAHHWYPIAKFLDLFVQERFFPIFCFLFGLSFAIFLDSAAQRSDRPRLLLTRRLIALGLLGAAHQLLQPGEALAPYAIAGLVILVPATWLPTWLVLTGGLLGTVASVTLVSGGILSIPGLFLLGLAVARLGIAHTLDRRTGQLAAVLALAAPAAAAAVWCQHTYSSLGPFATRIAAEAGLLGALTYATALLLLLRAPLGRPLSAVLEPLGRMALTNYITATLAITAASPLLGLKDSGRWGTAMLLAAGIIAVQAPFSHWWLRRFRYGPLEWCLRCVTWWCIVPIARSRVAAA